MRYLLLYNLVYKLQRKSCLFKFFLNVEPNLAHKAAKKDAALDKFFMRANQKMLADRAEHIKRLVRSSLTHSLTHVYFILDQIS